MADELIGTVIDQYQVVALLGEGPIALVYGGRQTSIDRPVAIKIYPRRLTRRRRDMERFRQETAVIARLEHINIAPMYAFGDYDNRAYIVERYFEGGSLSDLIAREAPFAPGNVARILQQITGALNYAHGEGVVHRNIKSSNVLLDSTGTAYLSDFALDSLGGPTITVPDETPAPASDVYALGALAFEMLSGQPPYLADNPRELAEMHGSSPVPSLSSFNPTVPVVLSAVVSQALAKNPADRLPSPASFADNFRQVIDAVGLGEARPFDTLPMTPEDLADAEATLPMSHESEQGAEPTLVAPPAEMTVPAPHRTQAPAAQPATIRQPPSRRRRSPLLLIVLGMLAVVLIVVGAGGALLGMFDGDSGLDLGALGAAPTLTLPPTPNPQTLTPPVAPADETTPSEATATPDTSEPAVAESTQPASGELPPEIDSFGVPMVLVAAGSFRMGNDEFPAPDQRPEHDVFLDAFYIDKFEVRNAQLRLCVQDDVCNPDHPSIGAGAPFYFDLRTPMEDYLFANHPVISITWERAVEYCGWRGARLPTEAEWEKAARWDPASEESRDYPWGDAPLPGNDPSLTNFTDSGYGVPVAVDGNEFPGDVSPVGAFYMGGNVSEWVSDWYNPDYYDVSSGENPRGPDSGQLRGVRGADYQTTSGGIILTTRDFLHPAEFNMTLGFRCAQPAQ